MTDDPRDGILRRAQKIQEGLKMISLPDGFFADPSLASEYVVAEARNILEPGHLITWAKSRGITTDFSGHLPAALYALARSPGEPPPVVVAAALSALRRDDAATTWAAELFLESLLK